MDEEEGSGSEIHDLIGGMLADMDNDDDAPEDAPDDAPDDPSEEGSEGQAEPGDEEGEGSAESDKDDDGIPTDPEELRSGWLRTADYTRKTQALAKQRKELEAQLAEIEQIKDSLLARKEAPKDKAMEPIVAQPPEGASAEELLRWYVKQEVDAARSKLQAEIEPLIPEASSRKFTDAVINAYREVLAGDGVDPVFSTKSAAELVGRIIETDDDLMDLAKSNPQRAIRLAMKSAKADLSTARKMKKDSDSQGVSPVKPSTRRAAARQMVDPVDAVEAALKKYRMASTR